MHAASMRFLPPTPSDAAEQAPESPGASAIQPLLARARRRWGIRHIPVLAVCGILTVATIALGTWAVLFDLRNRAIVGAERELQNIALMLAEQTDRGFQAIDLVQGSVLERIKDAAATYGDDYERVLSGYETH